MNEKKSLPKDLSPIEVFAVAIRGEMEARDIYQRSAKKVANEALQGKLLFLVGEEEKHRKILEDMYRDKFPQTNLALPDQTVLPKIDLALSDDSSIDQLFEVAMEWERLSGEFYEEMAERATDHGSRAILMSLSAAEWGHYHLLKSEYDLLQAFPSYASTKNFNPGEDFLHIGP